MKKLACFLIIILAFTSGCKPEQPTQNTNPLLGSWTIKEIHWITPDTTYAIKKAQPGIFMVSPKRYSIIWTPTRNPRIPFKILSSPTDEEILSGFRSIVFNTGTYTISNSTFNIKATIAKVPGFEGGTQMFQYTLDENNLELKMIDETYPNGDKPDWFGRMETLFIMSKID